MRLRAATILETPETGRRFMGEKALVTAIFSRQGTGAPGVAAAVRSPGPPRAEGMRSRSDGFKPSTRKRTARERRFRRDKNAFVPTGSGGCWRFDIVISIRALLTFLAFFNSDFSPEIGIGAVIRRGTI